VDRNPAITDSPVGTSAALQGFPRARALACSPQCNPPSGLPAIGTGRPSTRTAHLPPSGTSVAMPHLDMNAR
jgi:hypothetical protein